MKNQVYIVMYHYIRDLRNSRYSKIKGLDYQLFKQQIAFLNEQFHIIRMEDVLQYYKEGKELPEKAALLTFDDGYIDHYTYVFPILKQYGLQGAFFPPARILEEKVLLDVNKIHFILASADIKNLYNELQEQLNYYRGKEWEYPSNSELIQEYAVPNRFDTAETIFFKRVLQTVLPKELRSIILNSIFKKYVRISEEVMSNELYMNYDQMLHMKREGMFFGIHGYDHYWMNRLTEAEVISDVDSALQVMQDLVDKNSWVINYPYGSYSDDVVNLIQDKYSGCKVGISTEVKIADLQRDNRFILPRMDTNDFPPNSEKYLKY